MKCPFCGKIDNQVLESRSVNDNHAIRRRRKCLKCGKRFTTHESLKSSALWVVKKNGNRELFEKEKIKKGVLRAIEKRPVPLGKVDELVESVEREMLRKQSEEVAAKDIGKAIMRRLKKLDKVAWLRFASVYLEFEDLSDFERAIEAK